MSFSDACSYFCSFVFQAKEGILDAHYVLEFIRVLFRSQQGAVARLLPRRVCPGPPLLAVSPWALRRKARSALVYPRAVRMSECPAPPPAFAELVAATNYSFLRGASHPAAMVAEAMALGLAGIGIAARNSRSEEHTSELQSLMRISFAAFC